MYVITSHSLIKAYTYLCPVEAVRRLTDKGQFQYLPGLKRPQGETYLYKAHFFHKDKYQYFIRNYSFTPCKEVIITS